MNEAQALGLFEQSNVTFPSPDRVRMVGDHAALIWDEGGTHRALLVGPGTTAGQIAAAVS